MSTYIEHCKAVVASLDADQIIASPPGALVGESGSGFKFHQLGQFDTITGPQHIGAKVPLHGRDAAVLRLYRELPFIAMCVDSVAELRPWVPDFMGLIAVENSEASAILTEDASRGGEATVAPIPASAEVRDLLYRVFSQAGPSEKILAEAELERTTAFNVDGHERLLDFTPPPINPTYYNTYYYRSEECEKNRLDLMENRRDLTITVPEGSPLGQFLLAN